MNLSGSYSLELTPAALTLTAPSGAKIFTLSYRHLKNYGKQSGQFNFETGKNSPVGEGKLILVTTCSKEVFGVVHNNIKKLRETRAKTEPRNKPPPPAPAGQQPQQRQPLKSVPRPQPQKSIDPPPAPQQKRNQPIGSRPGSRHSTELADTSIPGTYRASKNMDEFEQATTIKEEAKVEDPSALYSTVDKSKKTSPRKQEQSKW